MTGNFTHDPSTICLFRQDLDKENTNRHANVERGKVKTHGVQFLAKELKGHNDF